MLHWFDRIDQYIAQWMQRYGLPLLRISIAVVFIWFGLLKPFGLSPANELISETVTWVSPDGFIPFLGWWEVLIGITLLFRPLLRVAIFLLMAQMVGAISPLFLVPEACFVQFPFVLTLEGQYIIKNVVIISAALVIGGTVRE